MEIKPFDEWPFFNDRIASKSSRKSSSLFGYNVDEHDRFTELEKKPARAAEAARRTQVILKEIMIRRNKNSELNGTRLINLKAKEVSDITIDLSPDERAIYSFVEQRAQMQFNKVSS